MSIIKNAIPKSYRAFYIEPGLADYTMEGIGLVLVQKTALDRINPTYIGRPVVNMEHTDKEPEELFELSKNSKPGDFADGIIAATGRLDEDYVFDNGKVIPAGWYYMDFLVWDQETIENIDEHGYSVSCAYDVTETGEGGSYHNVDFDEEVLNGVGLHLAIVPNPRYEDSLIIRNSKSEEEVLKIVFSKKKKETPVKKKKVQNAEPDEKDEETEEELENGYVENEAGEQIPIEELANMYREKQAKKNMGKAYNMDDEVEVDGKKMTVGELMAAIEEDEEDAVENAEPAQDEDAEEVVDESKQLSNSKKKNENFKKVKNAADKDDKTFKPKNLNTISERLTRGKSRYGTAVSQGGK